MKFVVSLFLLVSGLCGEIVFAQKQFSAFPPKDGERCNATSSEGRLRQSIDYYDPYFSIKLISYDSISGKTMISADFSFSRKAMSLMLRNIKDSCKKEVVSPDFLERPASRKHGNCHLLLQMNLTYDEQCRCFYSSGIINLLNDGKELLDRRMNGVIRFGCLSGGPIFDMYCQLTNSRWYYYTYERSLLQAVSSEQAFNSILEKEPERKRSMEKKNQTYLYSLASKAKSTVFLRQFEHRR